MRGNANINKQKIVEEYKTTKSGIETLALKYHIGKIKLKKILAEYGIEHKKTWRTTKQRAFYYE